MIITVPFSELKIWDVKSFYHQSDIFNKKYPIVLFGEFLTKPIISKVKIEDTKEYKILGARAYGKGAFVNRNVKGDTLKMRTYQQAKPNHLFWCKVDTKNGAFGIITEELADGVASSNMTFAKIETEKANPEFLQLLFKSKRINEYMDGYVSGTTNRKYIKPDQLRDEINIVLPPIEVQNKIVNNYKIKITLAEIQENEARKIEEEVDEYLLNTLEVSKVEKSIKKDNFLWFNRFSDINRWDVWMNKGSILSKKYYNTIFSDIVIGKPMYGANVKGLKRKSNTRYIRITDINEDGFLNDDFASPEVVEEKYLLEENDFLIARSGNTVGKTFLFKKKYGRAIFAGYLVKYKIDLNKVNPEYLWYFTKSYIFKKWIESNQRVSGQPNINGQEFLSAPIVLPSLDIQNQIANHLTSLKNKIKELKDNSEKNYKSSIEDFENEIFNS